MTPSPWFFLYEYPYPQPWGRPLGWECPKCGRVYAPSVRLCWICSAIGSLLRRNITEDGKLMEIKKESGHGQEKR